ncbi:hypothetical protein ACEPAG_9193 [Sanghuangporus baumii]
MQGKSSDDPTTTSLLIKLFRDSATITRSKPDCIMLEKGVDPMNRPGDDPFVDICESVPTDSRSSLLPLSDSGLDQASRLLVEASTFREITDHFIPSSNELSFHDAECEVERIGSIPRCCDSKDPDFRSPTSVSVANRNLVKQDLPIPRRTDGSWQIDNAMQLGEVNAGYGNTEVQPDCTVEARISENSEVHIIPEVSKMRMAEKDTVATVNDSLASTFAEQESPIIIAHNERKQRLLDGKGITKGVQFEIARGISHGWWTWDDITDEVDNSLHGTISEKARKVAQIIGKGPKRGLSAPTGSVEHAIYTELDREQETFVEHEDRGLGLKGPWKGGDSWYGGRIQLTAKLEFNKMNKTGQPPFSICLNGFHTDKSNRAARFFTSLSILQVK